MHVHVYKHVNTCKHLYTLYMQNFLKHIYAYVHKVLFKFIFNPRYTTVELRLLF